MTPEEEEKQIDIDAQAKIRESMNLAKEMNVILGDKIEQYKGDPAVMARAHLIIAHSMLRQSVCCLSHMGNACMGVWSRLERELMEDPTWAGPHDPDPKKFGGN